MGASLPIVGNLIERKLIKASLLLATYYNNPTYANAFLLFYVVPQFPCIAIKSAKYHHARRNTIT